MSRSVPLWLRDRLERAGGSVPFSTFMDWALHDPEHGYYGNGRARIGPGGDFATSPSLGQEFSALLLPQLIEWLEQLPGERLSLIEAGPGEGHLASQMVQGLVQLRPDLAARSELVLVEPNSGMAALQERVLKGALLPVRWSSWAALRQTPLVGVVVAHEVLDALPVDRLLWDGNHWRWQLVSCLGGALSLVAGPVLTSEELARVTALDPAASGLEPGWCTEVSRTLGGWFQACGEAIQEGILLVMDYALEARRYYAPSRSNGTLMAYRAQQATADPFHQPGQWDLTAHLCLEAVEQAAHTAGWSLLGQRRQGEALLALGLAERLASLGDACQGDLPEAMRRREQLLRLVDPRATGDFRWLIFGRNGPGGSCPGLNSRCLCDPPPLG